jgi:hypothetical protein
MPSAAQWLECNSARDTQIVICAILLKTLVTSYIPKILLQYSTTFANPPLPECFSATIMLATMGHDCLMNTSSTLRHEAILCTRVPPVKIKKRN